MGKYLTNLAKISVISLASLLPSCNSLECNSIGNPNSQNYSITRDYRQRLDDLKSESLQLARGMNRLSNKDLENRIFVPENHGMDFLTPLFQKISSHPRIEYDDDSTSLWIRNHYAEIGKISFQINYEKGEIIEIMIGNQKSVIGLKKIGDKYIGRIIVHANNEKVRDLGEYTIEEKELQPLITEIQILRAKLPKENPRRKEQEKSIGSLIIKSMEREKRYQNKPQGTKLGNTFKKEE